MIDQNDLRYWYYPADAEEHPQQAAMGMVGIADEERGGYVAWANDAETADRVTRALNLLAAAEALGVSYK